MSEEVKTSDLYPNIRLDQGPRKAAGNLHMSRINDLMKDGKIRKIDVTDMREMGELEK